MAKVSGQAPKARTWLRNFSGSRVAILLVSISAGSCNSVSEKQRLYAQMTGIAGEFGSLLRESYSFPKNDEGLNAMADLFRSEASRELARDWIQEGSVSVGVNSGESAIVIVRSLGPETLKVSVSSSGWTSVEGRPLPPRK